MFGSSSRPSSRHLLPVVTHKRVAVARSASQGGTSTTSDTSSLSTVPDHCNSPVDSPRIRRNIHSSGLRFKREQALIKRQLLERAFGALNSSGTTATTEASSETAPPVSNVYPTMPAEKSPSIGKSDVSRSEQARLQEENERLRNQLASMTSSMQEVDKEVIALRLEHEDHARQKDAALAQVADLAVRLANSLSQVNEVHEQLREEQATAREYRDKYEELLIQHKRLQAAQRMQRTKRRDSLGAYRQDSTGNLYGTSSLHNSSSRLSTSLHNTVTTTTTTTTPSPHSSIPRDLNCSVVEECHSVLDDSTKWPIPKEVGGDDGSDCSTLTVDEDWRHRSLMSLKTWDGNKSDMAVIKSMIEI